jgi:GNAT superfamily N-acetyltransferase
VAAEIVLRKAVREDASALTRIFIVSRTQCWDFLEITYDFAIIGGILERQTPHIWIAEVGGTPAGFLALEGNELDRLYVLPDWHGKGVGQALLGKAKEESPGQLWLWVFQKNLQARRFYERNGFVLDHLTDGEDNMEREPDARYVWRGNRATILAGYLRQVFTGVVKVHSSKAEAYDLRHVRNAADRSWDRRANRPPG